MSSLFSSKGVHVVCDGQYGSTGKGALSAYLAFKAQQEGVEFEACLTNGGPNSGHTFYTLQGEKVVLKQLPTFSVASLLQGTPAPPAVLTAGAIIDPDILRAEAERYRELHIYIHPNAAVIGDQDKAAEHSGTVAAVAGTRSGTGAALARKVLRDPTAVWGDGKRFKMPPNVRTAMFQGLFDNSKVFMEISQGFSLGINQGFYPKCTSRECTVSQGFADAGIPPRRLAKTYMAIRTYPIRVGNVDGHTSGEWYFDQEETTWEKVGVEPERTTVTNRVRRVATFSLRQFFDAMSANDPDVIFLNFMNYLPEQERDALIRNLRSVCEIKGKHNVEFLAGYGPKVEDILRVS